MALTKLFQTNDAEYKRIMSIKGPNLEAELKDFCARPIIFSVYAPNKDQGKFVDFLEAISRSNENRNSETKKIKGLSFF